jgi:hypothetical protein
MQPDIKKVLAEITTVPPASTGSLNDRIRAMGLGPEALETFHP